MAIIYTALNVIYYKWSFLMVNGKKAVCARLLKFLRVEHHSKLLKLLIERDSVLEVQQI